MPSKGPVERLVSAGGVVYRQQDGTVEVVLCGWKLPRLWALPKGTPNPGERVEETAIREVTEETGLEVDIQAPLDSINYWFVRFQDGVRCHKTVHFYLMTAKGGALEHHDPEFDEVRWFLGDDALKALIYPSEAKLVEQAVALVMKRGEHE